MRTLARWGAQYETESKQGVKFASGLCGFSVQCQTVEDRVVRGNIAAEFSEHGDKTYPRRRRVNLYKLPAIRSHERDRPPK